MAIDREKADDGRSDPPPFHPDYRGRIALITGASAGLGRAFAHHYAACGADLVLVARREERLVELATKLEQTYTTTSHIVLQDLSNIDAHIKIGSKLNAFGVAPDILVNNAGLTLPRHFIDMDWQSQQNLLMTMVLSVASLTHLALPTMQKREWGRILTVSSTAAFAPGAAGHTLYPAVKAFGLKFSRSLHEEMRGTGIHVTALCPGSTATEFQVTNGMAGEKTTRRPLFTETPAKVARTGITASEHNRAVIVSGLHNKIGVSALKLLPEFITIPLIRWGAARSQASNPKSQNP